MRKCRGVCDWINLQVLIVIGTFFASIIEFAGK